MKPQMNISHQEDMSLTRITTSLFPFFFFLFFFVLDQNSFHMRCSHETSWIYTERKKKRRVNFIPKFHSSLKKFVKYFTMITKWYMYGTKIRNFIGL